MNQNPPPRPDVDELLDAIAREPWEFPVRAIEAVLARSEDEDVVEPTLAWYRRTLDAACSAEVVEDDDDACGPTWLAVVLGLLGDARAAPDLAEGIRRCPSDVEILAQVMAEALARIGPAAHPEIASLAASTEARHRVWAYAAAGWIGDAEARDLLLAALDVDPDWTDLIAGCLGDASVGMTPRERTDAVERLCAMLPSIEPWQRPDVEGAIRQIYESEPSNSPLDEDWRLRYRAEPRFQSMLPSLPLVVLLTREVGSFREGQAPARSLEQILADPPDASPESADENPERCECCGVEPFWVAGVEVCPATALPITLLQHRILGELRDESDLDDVFGMLDLVDGLIMDVEEEPAPRGRRRREERDDFLTEMAILRGALVWGVEQGCESVGAVRARLLAEGLRLLDLYGDPDGHFASFAERGHGDAREVRGPREARGPAPPPSEVGRNDPCPCGSGRKYKKCCGRPDVATADQTRRAPPVLATLDGEPMSFCRAYFAVADVDAVRVALAGLPQIEAGSEADSYVWLGPGEEGRRQVLGTIELREDRLALECLSEERLARGRELLEGAGGSRLRHRADSTQDPWQALNEASERRAGAAEDESSRAVAGLSPDEQSEILAAFYDEHYRAWPDDPLPALGGRTAREAVRDPAGRVVVAALVNTMERLEESKPPAERYDFGWLREELGLDGAG